MVSKKKIEKKDKEDAPKYTITDAQYNDLARFIGVSNEALSVGVCDFEKAYLGLIKRLNTYLIKE